MIKPAAMVHFMCQLAKTMVYKYLVEHSRFLIPKQWYAYSQGYVLHCSGVYKKKKKSVIEKEKQVKKKKSQALVMEQ